MADVYLNGNFVPLAEAKISVLDRGFLFADSVFDVLPILNGQVKHLEHHIPRLKKSLQEILITNCDVAHMDWQGIAKHLIASSHMQNSDGILYIQITRGSEGRRAYPLPKHTDPTVFIYAQEQPRPSLERLTQGYSAICLQDIRPLMTHIKNTALLPTVLLQAQVDAAGADQAILIRDGHACEGISSNLFIVKGSEIYTPPLDNRILAGVTRKRILSICSNLGIKVHEQQLNENDVLNADEVMLTSTSKPMYPITHINQKPIGTGQAGPIWHKLIPYLMEQEQNER